MKRDMIIKNFDKQELNKLNMKFIRVYMKHSILDGHIKK